MNGCSFYFLVRLIVSFCVARFPKRHAILVTADVMILRVWAMYNRSRLILSSLLVLFSLEIIATVLAVAVDSDPKRLPGMWVLAE